MQTQHMSRRRAKSQPQLGRAIRRGFKSRSILLGILVAQFFWLHVSCVSLDSQSGLTSEHPADSTSRTSSSAGSSTGSESKSSVGSETTETQNGGPRAPVGSFDPSLSAKSSIPGNTTQVTVPLPSIETPKGSLEITAGGITELRQIDVPSSRLPALHVQTVIRSSESSKSAWTVDSRLQQVHIPGRPSMRAAFVRTQDEALPFIVVKPGETQIIDFYYILPADISDNQFAGAFNFDWQINTGFAIYTDQTGLQSTAEFPLTTPVIPRTTRLEKGETPRISPEDQHPSQAPSGPLPYIGVESDWWFDPFADLPPTWRDFLN